MGDFIEDDGIPGAVEGRGQVEGHDAVPPFVGDEEHKIPEEVGVAHDAGLRLDIPTGDLHTVAQDDAPAALVVVLLPVEGGVVGEEIGREGAADFLELAVDLAACGEGAPGIGAVQVLFGPGAGAVAWVELIHARADAADSIRCPVAGLVAAVGAGGDDDVPSIGVVDEGEAGRVGDVAETPDPVPATTDVEAEDFAVVVFDEGDAAEPDLAEVELAWDERLVVGELRDDFGDLGEGGRRGQGQQNEETGERSGGGTPDEAAQGGAWSMHQGLRDLAGKAIKPRELWPARFVVTMCLHSSLSERLLWWASGARSPRFDEGRDRDQHEQGCDEVGGAWEIDPGFTI